MTNRIDTILALIDEALLTPKQIGTPVTCQNTLGWAKEAEVKELKECTACGAQWMTSASEADCLDTGERDVPLVVVDDDPTAGFFYPLDKYSDY